MQTTADGGFQSLKTGNRLFSDISMPKRLLFATGLQPLDIAKQFDISSEMFADQERMRERVADFGSALAQAWVSKDRGAARDIEASLFMAGVPIDSVYRSANARLDNATRDLFDRQFEAYPLEQLSRAVLGRRQP
jgi:hypothetical protein